MAPLLIFLSAFAYFVTALFPALGPGKSGLWIAASMTPRSFLSGPSTIPLLFGRLLVPFFPVGSIAFRFNAVAALLVAASIPLLIFSLQRILAWNDSPALSTEELARTRRRDAAVMVTALLWLISPPLLTAAITWGPGSVLIFFSALWLWAALHPQLRNTVGGAGALAFLAGLLLAAEPRLLWVGGALLPLLRSHRPRGRAALWRIAGLCLAAFLGWSSGDLLLALWDSATGIQTLHAFGRGIQHHVQDLSLSALQVPGRSSPFGRSLWVLSPAVIPLAVVGARTLWKKNRAGFQFWVLWGLLTIFGPALGGPVGPEVLVPMAMSPLVFCAVGSMEILTRRPTGLPALFILALLAFLWEPAGESRHRWGALDQGADLLTSLPADAVFLVDSPETMASVGYQQNVLGRRRDVTVLSSSQKNFPVDRDVFTDSFVSLPDRPSQEGRPEGLVVRYEPNQQSTLISPLGYSLGRVPFFFFGPRRTDADQRLPLARAHHRLGKRFLDSRLMDEAEEELLRGLALAPEDEELHRDLGTLYLETHRGPRAALHFARAAANAPDGVRAAKEFNLWATAELSDGRVPQALEALRRGMERDRTNKEVRERLAELLEKAALPEEAAQEWRALREGWPEEKRYHWRLTQALLMAKDTRGAFHAVERYLSLPLTRAERQEAETFRESLANAVDAPLSGTPPAAETVAPSSAPSLSTNTAVEFSTAGASQ